MPQQLTTEEFAKSIKAKYPQYKDIPDADLTQKIIAKYPQYKDAVRPASAAPASAGTAPDARSATEVMQDQAAHVLKGIPQAITGIPAMIEGVAGAGWDILSGKGTAQAQELLKSTFSPVTTSARGLGALVAPNSVQAPSKEEFESAAEGAGANLGGIVASELGSGAIGKLREAARPKIRAAAQAATGTSAFKEVVPEVKKVTAEAGKVAEQRSSGAASQKLGEDVKALDAKLRTEGNEKYAGVKEAVKDDPGVPLADMSAAARQAQSMLKGSSESIKQFRELLRTPESSGPIHSNVGFDIKPGPQESLTGSGTGIMRLLEEQGIVDATGHMPATGTIPFDELQGYSSEIGAKLRESRRSVSRGLGGLPGDVYHALKYLKDKIDGAKRTIANRNGAGAQLQNAEAFWHNYLDTFYGSDSAVAKVHESVGTVDPEYYADPFTQGKAGSVAIEKLKNLPSRHAGEAKAIADYSENLRQGTLPEGTKAEGTTTTPLRDVPDAKAPTADEITDKRKQGISAKAESWKEMRPWDLRVLGSSVIAPIIAPFLGRSIEEGAAALGAGAAYVGVPKLAGAILDIEKVKNWIAQPTEADVAAASRLPEPARAKLVGELRKIIDGEKAKGGKMKVAPAVQRLIGQSGVVSGAVQNRRDALEKLGKSPE